jgi:quinoprotein glucose dehydrogenase
MKTPVEWPDYAGSPEGHRYIPLNQINKQNVTKLSVAWSYPHAETGFNPIVAHGIIYTKARNKSIVAVDAASGKELWVHDGLTGMTERGMNYWESKDGRIGVILLADYLQELDKPRALIFHSGRTDSPDPRGPRRDPNFMRAVRHGWQSLRGPDHPRAAWVRRLLDAGRPAGLQRHHRQARLAIPYHPAPG